jgi:hypothetical protein
MTPQQETQPEHIKATIDKLDSKPIKGRGGPRPGSGRPKGKKSPATLTREEALRQFRERVAKNTSKLLNAQMTLAMGTQMLFVIHTDSKGTRRKPEMITDTETISRFLDENEGVDGVMSNKHAEGSKAEDYYFMTTALPNNQALESLLNRTYGKAQENIDLTSQGEKLKGAIVGYVLPRPTDNEEAS